MPRSRVSLTPDATFFATPAQFRSWLRKHHTSATELWVGFHKKDSGKPSITWPESVDEALCFGWIDGVRKSLGDTSYTIRFTPRKKSSKWSDVNRKRVQELIDEGRMQPAGLRAFEARDPEKDSGYAYEQRKNAKFSVEQLAKFRANKRAWAHFEAEAPGYRHLFTWWVISAKREETRDRRLEKLIADCAKGIRLAEMLR
jgi:uncharacterized protein YdeI (YjbR/CyaY-like superfamily)